MYIKDLLTQRQTELEAMTNAMNSGDEIKVANHAGAVRALESVIEQERNTNVQVIKTIMLPRYPNHPGRAQRLAVGQIRRMDVRSGYAESEIDEVTA